MCLTRLFDCSVGAILSLWLNITSKESKTQTFLSTGDVSRNEQGIKIYQTNVNGSIRDLAIDVTRPKQRCTYVFRILYIQTWFHMLFTLRDRTLLVYFNGKEVDDFTTKGCHEGQYAEPVGTRMTLGKDSFPLAMFDELVIWSRVLNKDEVASLYDWYKGKFKTMLRKIQLYPQIWPK